MYKRVSDRLGQGNSWDGEAKVRLRLGQPQAALQATEVAIRLTQTAHEISSQYHARVTRLLALQALGRQAAALRAALAMLPLADQLRRQGITDWDLTRLAEEATTPYDVLLPALARRASSGRRALEVAESAHAPVLRMLIAAGRQSAREILQPDLRQALLKLERQRTEQQDRARQQVAEHAEAEASWLQMEAQYEAVYLDIMLARPKHEKAQTEMMRFAEIQQLVEQTGPALIYYSAPEEVVAFLLRPGQAEPLVKQIRINRKQLGEQVHGLRKDLGSGLFPARTEQRQRALGELLLGPFEPELSQVRHLRIVAHGSLHQLPFEALRTGGRPVAYAVSMVPSLWVLKELHRRRQELPTEALPPLVALASGEGLTLTGPEIDQIGRLFGRSRELVFKEGSDLDAYRTLAPKARHLLIASHGVQSAGSRLGTYIELRATDRTDGRLSAVDIAEIKLPKTELVTLAACDTARADAGLSDERLDLTRAYLVAGAAAVLGTRWRVPEMASTTQFLVDFYRALQKGELEHAPMRKDEALRRAREQSQDRGDPARQWAAWVLVGDGA